MHLSRHDNIALIKQYEEQTDQTFSQGKDLKGSTSIRKEIHEWVKIDGLWVKKEVYNVLVD